VSEPYPFSFYKSITVGSSETEHRDRGAMREWKHSTLCTESLHMQDTPQSRMSDHTDGPEAAAAGTKRMLEAHAPSGPQGKRRKHEERDVNPDNVSGLIAALAPPPAAAKKPRKVCEHQWRRSRCKDCGGSGLCEHQRQNGQCKDCGGSGLCEHQRQRSQCKGCGGGSICEHLRVRGASAKIVEKTRVRQ